MRTGRRSQPVEVSVGMCGVMVEQHEMLYPVRVAKTSVCCSELWPQPTCSDIPPGCTGRHG